MSKNLPEVIQFNEHPVRHFSTPEPCVPLTDIATAVGYDRANLWRMVHKDEVLKSYVVVVTTTSLIPNQATKNLDLQCLSKDGLVGLMVKLNTSRIKTQAKREKVQEFQRWAFSTLRQAMEPQLAPPIQLPSPYLTPEQKHAVKKLITGYVYSTEPKERYPAMFAKFYRHLKDYFKVSSYSEIPTKRFDEAQQTINRYAVRLDIIPASALFTSKDELELGLMNGEGVMRGQVPALPDDGKMSPEFIAMGKFIEAMEYMQAFAPDMRQMMTKIKLKVRKAEALQHQLKKLAN